MFVSSYQVYFGRTRTARPDTKRSAIVLSFASDDWNNFSYRTMFHYRVFDASSNTKPIYHGEIHVGFWDRDESPDGIVEEMLKGAKGLVPAGGKIYTMHVDLQAYRETVAGLEVERAEQVLLALNDLVAVQRLPQTPDWFEKATTSDVFNFSFIRNADTFFAFHNAGPILDGAEHEEIDRISQRLTLKFKLETFENEHLVDFRFATDGPLPRRMAVLIGKNGIGKSQTLVHIVSSLVSDDDRLRAEKGRPRINRLVAVSSPGEAGTAFPAPQRGDRIYYKRIQLQRPRANSKQTGLGDVLLHLVRSRDALLGAASRWDIFIEAIAAISAPERLFVRPRENVALADRVAPFPLPSMVQFGEQDGLRRWRQIHRTADLCRYVDGKIYPLSSGEVTFIRFAAQACLHIENGTLLLFDEPETHLHPNLITKFVVLLDRLLKLSGSLAILATHSAYFVREVPRSQVHVFREKEDCVVEIGVPRLRTLGADIGAISEFVFGDELASRLVDELKARLAASPNSAAAELRELDEDLPAETLMFLRRELGLNQP